MADLAIAVEQVGVPLGTLALSGAAKQVQATLTNRLSALVEFAAYDSSGLSVSFLYSDTATGTFNRAQPGTLRLPVINGQSWFFKQDQSAAPTLQANCAG